MKGMDTCAGPLIWFDVPDENGDVGSVALIECGGCGEVFTTSMKPDDRHVDTLVVR